MFLELDFFFFVLGRRNWLVAYFVCMAGEKSDLILGKFAWALGTWAIIYPSWWILDKDLVALWL